MSSEESSIFSEGFGAEIVSKSKEIKSTSLEKLTIAQLQLIFSGLNDSVAAAICMGLAMISELDQEDEELEKKSIKVFEYLSNERKIPKIMFLFGQFYENKEDHTNAKKYYKLAMDHGHTEAMVVLGEYLEGDDDEEAVRLYQKAADLQFIPAYCNLGVCYANGIGVERDYAKAAEYYQKAADKGHAKAANNLAIMYAKGRGVEKNVPRAVELYEIAANQNYKAAQYQLAVLLDAGDGIEVDHERANKLYMQVVQDEEEGRTSSKTDLPAVVCSQVNLAISYSKGRGIAKDLEKSAHFYKRAALHGQPLAQFQLAIRYLAGEGVPKNYSLASIWLFRAAQNGFEDAESLFESFEAGSKIKIITAEQCCSDSDLENDDFKIPGLEDAEESDEEEEEEEGEEREESESPKKADKLNVSASASVPLSEIVFCGSCGHKFIDLKATVCDSCGRQK